MDESDIDVEISLHYSVLTIFIIGIFIPLISAFHPVKLALSKTMIEALFFNIKRVEKIRKEKNFISGLYAFGFAITAFGVIVYFILPLGIINFDIPMVIHTVLFLLLVTLLSLNILALNL